MRSSGPRWVCPACGYGALEGEPWKGASPSDEICPSCGIQFGYDDFAGGDPSHRLEIYRMWREKWKAGGMRWWSKRQKPADWDPAAQLRRVQPH